MSLTDTGALTMAATTLRVPGAPARRDGAPPTQIGRYTVLKVIGAGGMGVVYAAYDNDLDRKIAIKLLHAHVAADGPETLGHSRLLREAQAMAKISHPNVLQVFEAGTYDGQVYLALEFVEGSTLEAWLSAAPRSWQAVVAMFLQAGRGLQAAHEAGLIHRDFKPENVLVDHSGRARVMDFGLARVSGEAVAELADLRSVSPQSSLRIALTETGAVMGTPLYMAPEQHLGITTDARTDEFAFCVALYTAVHGQRPFAGDDLHSLATNVLAGVVREPPPGRRVPGYLRRAIARGLAPAPADRFPDMPALLAEISRDPGVARRRALLIAGAISLVIAGGWGFAAVQSSADQHCRGAATQLIGTWDQERAAGVTRAFVATERPYAQATAERVQRLLGTRVAAWADLHRVACEAHARGEASAELYDLQVACLDRRRSETLALVDLFARADGDVVDRAVSAVMALPLIARCDDREALLARVKAPEDPTLATEVLRIRGELDRARAAQDAGKYKEGIALATAAAAAADTSEHRPVIAEARLRLGELHARASEFEPAGVALWAGLWAAEASGHDEVAAAAWTELTRLAGKLGQGDDARKWSERAGAAVARLGADTLAQARLENELGTLAFQAGEQAGAIDRYGRALALRRAVLGPTHVEVVAVMSNLANALARLDRTDEALQLNLEALAVREATLGPDHPDVAISLNNLGVIYRNLYRLDDAISVLNRARQIWQRALGPDNPTVINGLINLSNVYQLRGDIGTAVALCEQAMVIAGRVLPTDHPTLTKLSANLGLLLAMRGEVARGELMLRQVCETYERIHGPEHPDVAGALDNLAAIVGMQGRDEEARVLGQRALTIFERSNGPEHSDLVSVLGNLANVEARLGHLALAEALARRSLEISHKTFPPGSAYETVGRLALALVALARDQPTEALVELDTIARIYAKEPAEAETLANYRFLRARALLASGGDRKTARELAHQARALFGGYRLTRRRSEVEAWLAHNNL